MSATNKDEIVTIIDFLVRNDIWESIVAYRGYESPMIRYTGEVQDYDIDFAVNVNDYFYYATADAEHFSVKDLDAIQACLDEDEINGLELWVARKRGARPLKYWLDKMTEDERKRFEEL